eukprot:306852-Prymnesium_polylepis.1
MVLHAAHEQLRELGVPDRACQVRLQSSEYGVDILCCGDEAHLREQIAELGAIDASNAVRVAPLQNVDDYDRTPVQQQPQLVGHRVKRVDLEVSIPEQLPLRTLDAVRLDVYRGLHWLFRFSAAALSLRRRHRRRGACHRPSPV